MKDYMIQDKMPDYAISRQDILELVRECDPTFREGQMKRLLEYMIKTSKIEHVGRNKYRRINKESSKSGSKNSEPEYYSSPDLVLSI